MTGVFSLFGASHVLTILFVLLVAVVVPCLAAFLCCGRCADILRWVLATTVVSHELLVVVVYVCFVGESWVINLPLHICTVSALMSSWVLVSRSYRTYELVYFWGLGGALQAILTPDIAYGFPHWSYLSFFFGHGLVLLVVVFATVVFGFRPSFVSLNKAWLCVLVYAFLFVAPLNYLLGTNYLYLRAKPLGLSLVSYLGPWPWYLGSVAVLAWLWFLILYSPFYFQGILERHKKQRDE